MTKDIKRLIIDINNAIDFACLFFESKNLLNMSVRMIKIPIKGTEIKDNKTILLIFDNLDSPND